MVVYVQSFLIILLETLCCKIFFESLAEKRNDKNIILNNIIVLLLLVFIFFIANFFAYKFILKEFLIIIITTILMYILLDIHILKAFTLSIFYQGLLLVVDYFTLLLAVSFFSSTAEIEKTYAIGGALTITLGKAILFACTLFIKQSIGKRSSIILSDTEWLKFIFFPFFSICTIVTMISGMEGVENQRLENSFFVVAFGLTGMNIVVFYLIKDILKREQKIRENEIFKMQVENQTKMYRSISENFEKQRKKTHEYKNQILCIDSLISNKCYEDAVEYLKTIGCRLNKDLDSINTNNVIVNAILNTKYEEAIEKDILFIIKINDLSEIKIEDEDIVIILSNLLNNAIEACEKCTKKKVIKMKFVRESGTNVISVKNTYEGNLMYNKDEILTTKNNTEAEHGIGIKNIIDTIKKYDGSYVIRSKNQEFYFSIIIPE